jgi:hypothetical protein
MTATFDPISVTTLGWLRGQSKRGTAHPGVNDANLAKSPAASKTDCCSYLNTIPINRTVLRRVRGFGACMCTVSRGASWHMKKMCMFAS